MQKYKTIATLGDGAFGTVYKAINITTSEVVAIKKMKQKYISWNQCIQLRQIKSLRKFNHHNLMKLKEVLLASNQLYMVFQYLQYNLYQMYAKMKENGKYFLQAEIKSMVYQIANGLAHMHKVGFFHRDMKPENLLIYNNVVKICDFGLARQIRSRPPFTDYVSTRWYRAPQLLLRSTSYNSPVDIFALGCIMVEFYLQSPLFPGTNQIDQLNKIVKILGTPDKNDWPQGYKMASSRGYYFAQEPGISLAQIIPTASPQAINLIESMLKYSSRKRITAAEILKHKYFNGVNLPLFQQEQTQEKQTCFLEQTKGVKLDTVKQDQNLDIFRSTKQNFKQTRKQNAEQSWVLNHFENNSQKFKSIQKNDETKDDSHEIDQIDSLIKQIQQKGKKKHKIKQNQKIKIQNSMTLPTLPVAAVLRQKAQNKIGKKQMKPLLEMRKQIQKFESPKFIKNENMSIRKNQAYFIFSTQKNSRSGTQISKFAYSFQPAINNIVYAAPLVKSPAKQSGISFPLITKQKSLQTGPIYKY